MNTMKNKAGGILTAAIIIAVAAVVVVGLFLYPYSPLEPPQANDTDSTQQGVQGVVDANNEFAFEFYSELSKTEQGNIFYSPYSISSALAMVYEGAREQTANEIKNVFHFPSNNILRPNFASIYNNLNKKDKEYELNTGNALWVQQDFSLLQDYTNTVEDYYGGKASNVDFVSEPEKSRQTINIFIAEQTRDKIKDLIAPGMIDPLTRLILTNAIYFKGTWEWEFDKKKTRDLPFFITENNEVQVPMMYMDPDKARFNYSLTDELQILELPYKGGDISMLVLLPRQGKEYDYMTGEPTTYNYTLEDIELSSENLNEYKSQMRDTKMDAIYFPKFEFDTKYDLNKNLIDLGMPNAFNPSLADFSGMTGIRDLYIAFVIHQAYVKVDEKGTEAAAATAVGMSMSAAPTTNVFMADHPFIFLIQERETGNILFLGRVIDPR